MEKKKCRGRPPAMPLEDVEEIIERYVDKIFVNGQLVSKDNAIWKQMASDSKGRKEAKGFYSHIVDNRNGIKIRLLAGRSNVSCGPENNSEPGYCSGSDHCDESAVVDSFVRAKDVTVKIHFTHREFNDLLEQRSYNRTEKDGPLQRSRCYTVFKPNVWQQTVTEKLWAKKIQHGFQFKTHKISLLTNTAYFQGRCKCGSKITGTFEDITCDNIDVTCSITPGKQNASCGKRYLRAPERETIGKLLTEQNKAVGVYRAERADDLMTTGDYEPPHLYNANVLRVAKQQYKQAGREHSNVVTALEMLQLGSLTNIVHGFGLNPFFLHYWTHHQLDAYRNYCKMVEAPCIMLDATGSIVRPIARLDKTKTKVIYLYECVVHSGTDQFSVAQMITEAHNTNNIQFWLMEWLRSGAPFPREVVVDSSVALLSASIRCFTGYRSIDEYADACTETTVPTCYVRIDVAHFLKMYADFLKTERPRIKRFFLASIGQLILSSNKMEAEERLTWVLTVTRSETEGSSGSSETLCENRKRRLQQLITGFPDATIDGILDEIEEAEKQKAYNDKAKSNTGEGATAQPTVDTLDSDDKIELPNMQVSECTEDESELHNSWKLWGREIDQSVLAAVSNELGNRENAHFLPRLADRLVRDVKWLPLWSCVCRNGFGYGRQPASSASVESDFNDLKNRVLKNDTLPMRADDFVSKHVTYLRGRSKLIAGRVASQPTIESDSISQDVNIVLQNGIHEAHNSKEKRGKIQSVDESTFQGRVPAPSLTLGTVKPKSRTEDFARDVNSSLQDIANYPEDLISDFDEATPLANSSMLETCAPKVLVVTRIEKLSNACIACSNGNLPGDAHVCIFCQKPVHVLPGCSVPAAGQDEGYGQKRVCASCTKHHADSVAAAITSNEMENWRGLANKNNKKKSRYLQPNYQQHELLLHEKLVNVPILRSGDQMGLQAVTLGKRKVTLSNTCPFDSIFQLFLSAALDFEDFLIACGAAPNDFLKLVHKVAKKGVNASTYRKRAEILSHLCEVADTKCEVDLIDCQFTVSGLCCELFKRVSSLTEVVTCLAGCPERRVHLPRIQVHRRHLQDSIKFTEAVESAMVLEERLCGSIDCPSAEPVKVVIESGFFLIVEISIEDFRDGSTVQLQDLPATLNLAFSEGAYKLVGAIHYLPPGISRRSSENSKKIGHYMAISHRRDFSWVIYNGRQSNEKVVNSKYKALVEILLYIKQ